MQHTAPAHSGVPGARGSMSRTRGIEQSKLNQCATRSPNVKTSNGDTTGHRALCKLERADAGAPRDRKCSVELHPNPRFALFTNDFPLFTNEKDGSSRIKATAPPLRCPCCFIGPAYAVSPPRAGALILHRGSASTQNGVRKGRPMSKANDTRKRIDDAEKDAKVIVTAASVAATAFVEKVGAAASDAVDTVEHAAKAGSHRLQETAEKASRVVQRIAVKVAHTAEESAQVVVDGSKEMASRAQRRPTWIADKSGASFKRSARSPKGR
jgi:hypothetical protein